MYAQNNKTIKNVNNEWEDDGENSITIAKN